jgi:O-methyltransferase involved in polyketide biosynthesis
MKAPTKNEKCMMEIAKPTLQSQDKIAETILTALHVRASEGALPNSLLHDESAQRMVEQIDYDFSRLKLNKVDQVSTILRVRQFDRFTQDFLTRHPSSGMVQIGCGLDTRFGRVDNGQVEWCDLDLAEVIEFHRKLVYETERYHMLGFSVFNDQWIELVRNYNRVAYLFLAEQVFPYFSEQQVKGLFLILKEKFPGCELVYDAMTNAMIRVHNLELSASKVDARLHWGQKNGHQPETWAPGIHLMNEWFYFDEHEPRLGLAQLMRTLPIFGNVEEIYHYQLGDPTK